MHRRSRCTLCSCRTKRPCIINIFFFKYRREFHNYNLSESLCINDDTLVDSTIMRAAWLFPVCDEFPKLGRAGYVALTSTHRRSSRIINISGSSTRTLRAARCGVGGRKSVIAESIARHCILYIHSRLHSVHELSAVNQRSF